MFETAPNVFFLFLQTSSRVDAIQLYYEKKSKIQKGSQKGFNTLQDTYTPTLKHTYTHKTAHTGPYRRMILFLLLYIFGTLAPLFLWQDTAALVQAMQCCLLLLLLHQVGSTRWASSICVSILIYFKYSCRRLITDAFHRWTNQSPAPTTSGFHCCLVNLLTGVRWWSKWWPLVHIH